MKLNKEQYRAAHHLNGPMLVLAGPGSGKTHLLVERIRIMIEEKHIPPEHILVITFSKKAARQMQKRFEKRVAPASYPVTFGTFHAVFYHILKEYKPQTPRLITEEEQMIYVRQAVKTCQAQSDFFSTEENTEIIIGLMGAYKNFGEDVYENNDTARDLDLAERDEFKHIFEEYDSLCRQNDLIDFDDMILNCRAILYKHESILRRWQSIYRYFLVDEFQDINDAQYDILKLLAGDEKNVFAVGDDDQSIYAFRGARPQLMKKFLHQFSGCKQVTLLMNYRCSQNVIGAADTVIKHNRDRLDRPVQKHLPSNAGGDVITVHSENSAVQAAFVCDMIDRLINTGQYRPSDFAVLYRSEHCAAMFVRMAQERGFKLRAGVALQDTGNKRKIHEAYIRAKKGTADRADYFLIMNNPDRGLSREALRGTHSDFIKAFIKYYSDDTEKLSAVRDLERTIRGYDEQMPDEEAIDPADMINVMTAHASKGLEYNCVFVIGLQEGLFPHYKNMTGLRAEEERRLMYVAMTRAKERLYLCSLGSEHGKRPSRFIYESMENMRYISDCLALKRI